MTRPCRNGLGPVAPRARRGGRGYTLVELAVVIAIAGLIMAIAIPQLMPTILFSNLEGAARHMAGYGRAAMAHAVIAHERLTIRIDLSPEEDKPQQYWAIRWLSEYELEENGEGMFDDETFGRLEETAPGQKMQDRNAALYQAGSQEAMNEQARMLQERFDRFATLSLQSKARNVKHDGILSETGDLFEGKEFSLDDDADEESVDEVKTSLLERTRLPEGVRIESVRVGTSEISEGLVEVDVTTLGLAEPVYVYLKSEETEEYFTVSWDAITGNAHLYEGKEEML
ncbi:MAG: type II secretion system protein [Candidatus Hydrogenedentota bacterium]